MANKCIKWKPEKIEALVNDVYSGVVTRDNLPRDLYEAIVEIMTNSIVKGFGKDFEKGSAASDLLVSFKQNVSVFSAAKTYQQINDMSNFVIDEAGEKISFSSFKQYADEIFKTYNVDWLETEFNTAFSLSQSAQDWLQIEEQKDALPMLRFSTVGDNRVRDDHADFDGITLPVDDPFWDNNYPPLDWNCRCIVTQHEADEYEKTSEKDLKALDLPEIPDLFKGNPAKSGYIFDENAHPYFLVADKYKKENFGL
ncbi:hypothetical protein [Flavobacterium phage FPSV-S1]|nr:hypothetical protein [Flavobacterium phage FPSV-S1]QCW20639.1 hypothetical protein [Flavobacterium phage FPSV-S27]